VRTLGATAFEQTESTTDTEAHEENRDLLLLRHKGMLATGYETTREFVVQKGAQISETETPSSANGMRNQRQALINNGIINTETKPWTLSQDYGSAASVVIERSANGRTEWLNNDGIILKVLQENDWKTNYF